MLLIDFPRRENISLIRSWNLECLFVTINIRLLRSYDA